MNERYLSDELWEAVAPMLPGKDGDPGCSGRDNRLFLEAVFWIARTGSPWRSLPAEFGKWYTTYTRFHRWTKNGVWPRVVEALEKHGAADFAADESGLRWSPLRDPSRREPYPRRRSRRGVNRDRIESHSSRLGGKSPGRAAISPQARDAL